MTSSSSTTAKPRKLSDNKKLPGKIHNVMNRLEKIILN
jgi:hypothetical protein